jgi:hypothetical protein
MAPTIASGKPSSGNKPASPWQDGERDERDEGQRGPGRQSRAKLVHEVIAFKRARGMGVVDRKREDEMLLRIGAMASDAGLDPRIAQQVLRAVIDAFTLMEVEELGDE